LGSTAGWEDYAPKPYSLGHLLAKFSEGWRNRMSLIAAVPFVCSWHFSAVAIAMLNFRH
jgi:hypothetical protein